MIPNLKRVSAPLRAADLIPLLLTILIVACAAGGARGSVRHINVRDGLSSRQVYEVDEDPDRFIWFYTNSGIDRFDGHNMKHYSLNPGEDRNDHIQSATSMETAPDGTLWIAVKSGAIYRYDRRLDRFDQVFSFGDPSIMLYNFTFTPDGDLVVCGSNGLYLCSEGREIEKMALDGKLVRAVARGADGSYYAGTDHGLYNIVKIGNSWRSNFVKGTEGVNILSIVPASGKLYLGSFSNGVLILDTKGAIGRLPFNVPPLPVNAMKSYGRDSLLIGVDGAGMYMIDTADDRLLRYYRDGEDDEYNISGNTVTDILVDRDKGIWVTTSHNGVNYIPPHSHAVNVIRSKSGNPASPVSDYINVIFEDSDGDLWFGTDNGVSRYSPSQNRWWKYLQRNDYVASVVLSFGQDSLGRILIGTYGDGLYIVDKKSGSLSRLPGWKPGTESGVGTDYVFAGYGTPDGKIWIGGINGALTCYDIKNDSYRYYDEDCVAAIVSDGSDDFILGGNKGVGKYFPESDSFEWKQKFDTVAIRYPVRVLLTDSDPDGTLWIGTQGDGLVRYNRKKGTARRFTTADGLSSNTIYSLARDKNGGVWICTETDLYRFDPTDNRLMRFTGFMGATQGVFNAGGGMSTRSGDIMLGTAEGCLVFNPTEGFKQAAGGEIQFTGFKVNGRNVEPGAPDSPLDLNINVTDGVVLPHNQNSFQIDFTLINYAAPQRMGLEYILEGYDKSPYTTGASASVHYTDLPPGRYTLVVKALDLYSGHAFAERKLSVTVKASAWKSPWAITIYLLLSIAIATGAVSYYNRVRRERRIESQLRSYATIAHDIRTPMSMIKAPLLSVELESDLSDHARANLLQARSGIDKTMSMLDEMLGLRREADARRSLQVQPVDVGKYLQVKIEEYSTLALFKGIRLECRVAPDMPPVPLDIDRFDHIVDNLLSNAIKYTNEGSVTLTARITGRRKWALEVADTGIGIAPEDARHVFKRRHRSVEAADCDASGTGLGLIITSRLVTDHRGSISFSSKPGEGTTFTVTLPLAYPSRYQASATRTTGAATTTGHDHAQPAETASDNNRSTIVVIDDDADMISFLKAQLGDVYNVIDIAGTPSAPEEIKELNPDLVISDVMMPRLRGDELCRMLKTNIDTSHIPVILLTGLAGRKDILAGLEARADDYVIKPFDIVVLKARIRNIINTRKELGKRILAPDCEPAPEEFANELDRRFMTRTMEIINNNISDSDYSVNELCADLGMSRTSVYNKIKSISGQSPNEFLRIVRLNRAKELLATHTYNISEVAYMVGFSDPKYFSTCFKKQFGVSPSKV